MSSKKQTTTTDSLPYYLKDLNSSANFYDREEYSYLQGLPIRPTKRRRFVPQYESCSSSAADASCLSPPGSGEFVVSEKNYFINLVASISSLALIVGATVLMRRQLIIPDADRKTAKRKKEHKGAETIVVDSDTGSVEVIQNSIANPLDNQLKSSDTSKELNERNDSNGSLNGLDTSELQIMAKQKSSSDLPMCQPSRDTQSNRTTDDNIISLDHTAKEEEQLIKSTIPPIEQLAQRWESRGLDKQKSLELAAHFEMNMLYFRELQHFLAVASYNLMNKFDLMHSTSLEQMERHQQENINLPYQEKMRIHRKQIAYMAVNTSVLTRCVVVAIASKLYFLNERSFVSFSDGLSAISNTICPECSESNKEEGQQLTPVSLYGFEYLNQFMGTISCTFLCSIKSVWYASLLAFCHQYISRSLSCSIIALMFVDWKSLFHFGVVVMALNICLTVLVYKYMEVKGRRMEIRDAAHYYEQCASFCEVMLLLTSVAVGFYFSL